MSNTMSKLMERAADALGQHALPAETVLGAAEVQLEGNDKQAMAKAAIRKSSGLVGSAIASVAGEDDRDLGAALGQGAVIVLTDQRVLIFGGNFGTDSVENLEVSFARNEIANITVGTKRVMMVKVITFDLPLGDGDTIGFFVPKPSTKDAKAILSALGAAV